MIGAHGCCRRALGRCVRARLRNRRVGSRCPAILVRRARAARAGLARATPVRLRVLPLAAAVAGALGVVLPTFLWFEPSGNRRSAFRSR